MANRYFQQFANWLIRKPTYLIGTVNIAADASVSSFNIPGVASVENTATGTYTITLEDTYYEFIRAHFTLQAATAVDLVPQIVSTNVTSTKEIVVKLLTGATATDPAAVCVLHVDICAKNTSV